MRRDHDRRGRTASGPDAVVMIEHTKRDGRTITLERAASS